MALPPPGIIYDDIALEIVKTNVFTLRPVYSDDNVDLLWVHAHIDVTFVFNPSATTSDGGGAGNSAPQSIADLYRRLMTPRKRLIYRVGNIDIIDVPTLVPGVAGNQRYATDAHNGPKPIDLRVAPFMGIKTAMGRYVIECFIPACDDEDAASLGAVSHRWEMTSDLDYRYMDRRVTIGQAHFRSDYLQRLSLYPDQFRPRIVHPLIPGYKRESVRFSPSEDGTAIRYQIVDQERFFQIEANSGIAEIRASYQYGYTGIVGGGITGFGANPTAYHRLSLEIEGQKEAKIEQLAARGVKAAVQLDFHPANPVMMTEARASYQYDTHTMSMYFSLISNGLLGQATALFKPTIAGGTSSWPRLLDGLGKAREMNELTATGPPSIYGNASTLHYLAVAQALGIVCELPGRPATVIRKSKDKFIPTEDS